MKKKRQNLIAMLTGSLSLTLTVCIFTPLDLVLNNQSEFALSFGELAQLMILPAITMFAVLLLVQMLAMRLHVFRTCSRLLLGVSLMFAAQELFMNGSMTDAETNRFVGEVSATEKTVNSVICMELLLVPSLAHINAMNRQRKGEKAKEETAFQRILPSYLFCALMLVQGAGFAASYFANDPGKQEGARKEGRHSSEQVFSMEQTYAFSQENNILVFLVDRFDTRFCDALMESYPEMKTELDGFTFYQNNLGASVRTFPSVASMLTNVPYDDSPDYLEKAWKNENVLSVLKNNGYTVNLLPDCVNTAGEISRLEPFCDNILTLHNTSRKVLKEETRDMLIGIGMARLMPYALKPLFTFAADRVDEVSYISYSFEERTHYFRGHIGNSSDIAVYDALQNAVFHADADQKQFMFLHLNGAHDDNPEMAEKTGIPHADATIETVRADFESILVYLHKAKELGVYDQTTFIILGDHGATKDDKFVEELTEPNAPALLVKPAGAEHGSLKYDRDSAVSNDMFSASVLEYAGLDHAAYGYSYSDIAGSGIVLPRRLKCLYEEQSETIITEYEVNGDARDFSNWKIVGKVTQ